jgi:glycosyltransferase involved in cell wall biosynthesis
MSALRILHVDAGREWRGGQRQVFLLAQYQREHAHEPLVVSQPDSPLIRRVRSAGLAAAAVRMRADWDLAAARRVRILVRKWRPNVVHAHDARAHAIALAALVGDRQVPLVVTRRVAFPPRGRLKYGDRVAHFIAISHAVREALVRGEVDPDRITVVYSGVPAPPVTRPRDWRVELGWPSDSVVCGMVGAMTAEKGGDVLARIAACLTSGARARVRLVLLGGRAAGAAVIGGLPTYRAGFVDAVYDAMAGLDVLWHPSSTEGLGTAVIDAMGLGIPPIAFAVGGLPEVVESGASGELVPPGDVRAFGRAASALVLDPERRARLGEHARERAAYFSVGRMAQGTERVYLTALSASPLP